MMTNRRDFLGGMVAAGAAPMLFNGCATGIVGKPKTRFVAKGPILGELVHLGFHMWSEDEASQRETIRFDENVWRKMTEKMVAVGMNMVVFDLAEGLVWPSHPELAKSGAWTPDRLADELERLRRLGLEPIPKLNFSASHDLWLGECHRMISTPRYYSLCEDLINDACEIFSTPRLVHLGYDEENALNQQKYEYAVVRQKELWWHDFLWFVAKTEKLGMRPWIWSDYSWHHKEEFFRRMPRSVLQSNWYYRDEFDPETAKRPDSAMRLRLFAEFDKQGFDQVPCGSNYPGGTDDNFRKLVRYTRTQISPTETDSATANPARQQKTTTVSRGVL
ncbi:MAG TPA: hypothetical protein PKI32_02815 [Opitutales bacterium]|nr:hypothetical protein [Opitutales bacterium]